MARGSKSRQTKHTRHPYDVLDNCDDEDWFGCEREQLVIQSNYENTFGKADDAWFDEGNYSKSHMKSMHQKICTCDKEDYAYKLQILEDREQRVAMREKAVEEKETALKEKEKDLCMQIYSLEEQLATLRIQGENAGKVVTLALANQQKVDKYVKTLDAKYGVENDEKEDAAICFLQQISSANRFSESETDTVIKMESNDSWEGKESLRLDGLKQLVEDNFNSMQAVLARPGSPMLSVHSAAVASNTEVVAASLGPSLPLSLPPMFLSSVGLQKSATASSSPSPPSPLSTIVSKVSQSSFLQSKAASAPLSPPPLKRDSSTVAQSSAFASASPASTFAFLELKAPKDLLGPVFDDDEESVHERHEEQHSSCKKCSDVDDDIKVGDCNVDKAVHKPLDAKTRTKNIKDFWDRIYSKLDPELRKKVFEDKAAREDAKKEKVEQSALYASCWNVSIDDYEDDDAYCTYCKDHGHTKRHCQDIECYNCGEHGHISWDCDYGNNDGNYAYENNGDDYDDHDDYHVYDDEQYAKPNYAYGSNYMFYGFCFSCGVYGHKAMDCDDHPYDYAYKKRHYVYYGSRRRYKNVYANYVCYYCDKYGHIQRDCWHKHDDEGRYASYDGRRYGYTCGYMHTKNDTVRFGSCNMMKHECGRPNKNTKHVTFADDMHRSSQERRKFTFENVF